MCLFISTLQPRPPPKPPLATPYIWFPFLFNSDLNFCIISVGHDDPATQGSGRKKYCKLNRHLHVLVDINIRRDLPPNPLPIQCWVAILFPSGWGVPTLMVGGSGELHAHHVLARRLIANSCVDWQYIFHPPLRVLVFQLHFRVWRHEHDQAHFFCFFCQRIYT